MKTIVISGNIGKDAVTRATQNGDKVTGWTVAVEDRQGQEKRTIWFDCALWGKRGESLAQYLTKGSKVSVAGDFSTREREGKTYLTIRVDQVTLGGKPEGQRDEPQAKAGAYAGAGGGYDAGPARSDMDDEIPF